MRAFTFAEQKGLTLVEIIVVMSISLVLITVLTRFVVIGYPISKVSYLQQRSTETARLRLKRMTKIIREARQADTGAYALVEASPQRFIFYSDLDADATTERVRYELVGSELLRGVTEPTGSPLTYDLDNEVVTVLARTVRNGAQDVFTYYSGDYPEDSDPLSPTDLTEVKYIQLFLVIDVDEEQDPSAVELRSQVQLRNLKVNLGETEEES